MQTFILVDENTVEPLIAELEETASKFSSSGGGGGGNGNGSQLLVDQDHELMAKRLIHTAREAVHVCTDACQHD